MSDTEVVTPPAPPAPVGTTVDRAAAIYALAEENDAYVARLRRTQIPQHVGMAAACRQLAVELPVLLAAQVEADLRTGVLARRWEESRVAAAEDATSDAVDPTLAAIALLVREYARTVTRLLGYRGKEWTANANRLEGHATALEGQAERLRRVVGAPPRADADTTAYEPSDRVEATG